MRKKMKNCLALVLTVIALAAVSAAGFAEDVSSSNSDLVIEVVAEDNAELSGEEITIEDDAMPLAASASVQSDSPCAIHYILFAAAFLAAAAGTAAVCAEQKKLRSLKTELQNVRKSEGNRK